MKLLAYMILITTMLYTHVAYSKECDHVKPLNNDTIISVLKSGGFSYPISKDAMYQWVGCYLYKETELSVYYYLNTWGEAQRSTQRIILIVNGRQYLGMYPINDKPDLMEGALIKFNYPSQYGNVISLKNGPPKKIYLDGETSNLFK
ncbi:hypothetical protein [Celerinatantimonas sp. MCCC 1A17872]|uniref:hypothetical protein n=1 Tax=Celerinatantimonas sp. MCCC 1A17872 TaxID=3177514 RepID=UPI0038C11512